MKMSDQRLMSGRAQTIGNGAEVNYPIELDPAQYKGAVIYASDKNCYYSDGETWRIPATVLPIARPRAVAPLNSLQQTQLRLSKFFSSTGEFQAGVQFEVSLTNNFENDILFTRSFTDDSTNMYQTLYPDDGLGPNQQFYWRAVYTGSDGSQSEYSLPYLQTYAGLIDRPNAITTATDRVSAVTVTAYSSPEIFGLSYYETQTEFYTEDGNFILGSVTQYSGASTTIPDIPEIPEGVLYRFRTRYGGRALGSTDTIYSDWSDKALFFNGAGSMMLQFDLSLAPSRTITLNLAGVVDATVFWGDGTSNVYTGPNNPSKVYSQESDSIANIAIKGTLTQFRVSQNSAPALRRVDSWGLKLGLTNLANCLAFTTNTLQYVSPDLPPTVVILGGMFGASSTNCDLSNLNVSNVINMGDMFAQSSFNGDISNWNVSNVTSMQSMFISSAFNQPIGNWDVSNVTNMVQTFYNAGAFNQDISNWNVSNVTDMTRMFSVARAFNGDISNWNVAKVTSMSGMFQETIFNRAIGNWNVSNVTNMAEMFAGSRFNQSISNWDVRNVTVMYGMFAGSLFNGDISNWNVSNVTSMQSMFSAAIAFNQPIGNWDVSNVISMAGMFQNSAFNQPLNNWDVSNVVNMSYMFAGAVPFNQPIGNWDVSNVIDMFAMFDSNFTFQQDISNWTLNKVSVNLDAIGLAAFTKILYSLLLVGWANSIYRNGGPFGITFPVSPTRQYDNTDLSFSFPGGRFANAVEARAYLTSPRGFVVANATNASANGQYTFNSTNSTYTNSTSGWYFIKIINDWQLRNNSNAVQDVSAGNQSEPYLVPLYTTVLASATYDPTGAQWTITGDQLV